MVYSVSFATSRSVRHIFLSVVAHSVLGDFPDGSLFNSLASVSDRAFVIPTIAQALGLQDSAHHSLFEMLKAFLAGKRFLFLLDNFEQVMAAAPMLLEVLETCSQVKMLVTSREVLHLLITFHTGKITDCSAFATH